MKRKSRRVEWVKLDNASKIFPATANHKDTKVFRMFCELNEDVDPTLLQTALERTLHAFPLYRSVLRRGVFWYYFEDSQIEAKVEADNKPLYSPLYIKGERMLAFRANYHRNRINVEIFHALSDGTGAFWFLQTLVYHYLILKHPATFGPDLPDLGVDASQRQRIDDSFDRHFRYRIGSNEEHKLPETAETAPDTGSKAARKALSRRAYQIPGDKYELGRTGLIEGELSAAEVLKIAHEYNATLTVFITAVFIHAIYEDMPYQKKPRPVSIAVPVNLRQFYSSETARNFFSIINVRHLRRDKVKTPTLEELIEFVQNSFKSELNEEQLTGRIMSLMRLENLFPVRIIPTSIKDTILRFFHWLSDLNATGSVSNMGRVKMPAEMMPFIHHFGVSTSVRRPQICACSTGDRLLISFSSPLSDNEVQRRFFNFFTSRGLKVTLSSNIAVLPDHRALAVAADVGLVGSSEAALKGALPMVPKEDIEQLLESSKQKGEDKP